MRRSQKRRLQVIVCSSLVVLYLVAYALNTLSGGYWLKPDEDGRPDYDPEKKAPLIYWQPRFGYVSQTRVDTLGTIFFPLVVFDRAIWHRTKNGNDEATVAWLKNEAPLSDIHPEFWGVVATKRRLAAEAQKRAKTEEFLRSRPKASGSPGTGARQGR